MLKKLVIPYVTYPLKRNYCYKVVRRPDYRKNIDVTNKTIARNGKDPKTSVNNNDLTKYIRSRILSTGPITIAEYMREILTNPQAGYYMQKDVFGKEGDFITSPEISQIFGELVAIWILNELSKLGGSNFHLIELGPGRGTLTCDILRVLSKFLNHKQFSIHLIEISPYLSEQQARRLCYKYQSNDENNATNTYYRMGETVSGIQIYWYKRLEDVPQAFSIIVANEFFDALPIHKLQMVDNIWKEVLVDVNDTDSSKSQFRFVLSRTQTPIAKIYQPIDNESRQCLEYSIEAERLITVFAERLEQNGGFALIMDYGHFGEKTDTFRAFYKHKLHDPLIAPGCADLTADVDFRHLKHIAERKNQLFCLGPIEQGMWLQKMQGEVRLEQLMANALPEQRENLKSSYEMLVQPEQMGKRFKFFAMFPWVVKERLTEQFPVMGFH